MNDKKLENIKKAVVLCLSLVLIIYGVDITFKNINMIKDLIGNAYVHVILSKVIPIIVGLTCVSFGAVGIYSSSINENDVEEENTEDELVSLDIQEKVNEIIKTKNLTNEEKIRYLKEQKELLNNEDYDKEFVRIRK